MTQQMPSPTTIDELLWHLSRDHPYQNKMSLQAGFNEQQIFFAYNLILREKARELCKNEPDSPCKQSGGHTDECPGPGLAVEVMFTMHDMVHGITHELDRAGILWINSNFDEVIAQVNAHHTHISTVPDTLEELLGNL